MDLLLYVVRSKYFDLFYCLNFTCCLVWCLVLMHFTVITVDAYHFIWLLMGCGLSYILVYKSG